MQCYHCGREVLETVHTQKSFKVDFYLLHTGHTEWEFIENPKQNAPPLRYRKLTQAIDIFTCVQCYARPAIQQLLGDDFSGRRELVDIQPKNTHEQN